jgi:enoyl-CoA hydratase/carnithine racemase
MLVSGNMIGAEEALQHGLLDAIVAATSLRLA